jgi:sec-independent protein translocase protein TatA
MFDGLLEGWHPIILIIIALIVFGPGKLPEVFGQFGRGVREFRSEFEGRPATQTHEEHT